HLAAEHRAHGHDGVEVVAGGGDLVHGEARVAARAAGDGDACLVGCGEAEDLAGDRLALVAREVAGRRREEGARRAVVGEGAHAVLPVLMTLIWRWRVGTQPWLTALLWLGCPLPSELDPPST